MDVDLAASGTTQAAGKQRCATPCCMHLPVPASCQIRFRDAGMLSPRKCAVAERCPCLAVYLVVSQMKVPDIDKLTDQGYIIPKHLKLGLWDNHSPTPDCTWAPGPAYSPSPFHSAHLPISPSGPNHGRHAQSQSRPRHADSHPWPLSSCQRGT